MRRTCSTNLPLAAGTAQAASSPAAFDLELEAAHDDLSGFANQLIGPGTLGAGLGALALKGHAIGTAAKFQVEDLAGTIGPIELSGSLSADLEGAGPAWNLDLKTGVLPIAALLPQRRDPAGAGKNGSGGAKQEARWSNETLGFPDLSALNGAIKLASGPKQGSEVAVLACHALFVAERLIDGQ